MYDLFHAITGGGEDPVDKEILLDLTYLRFIEPVGVTVLYNTINWLGLKNVVVKVYYGTLPSNPSNTNPIKYLDDCGFFEQYLGRRVFQSSSLRVTTIPVKNVAYSESFGWLDSILIPWLMRELEFDNPAGFASIKTSLLEIFNNIKDHSAQDLGCVFAQHFPRLNEIKLAISDFGVGIPHNIKKLDPSANDAKAIELAVQEGYSTKSYPTNRGSGLDILIKLVVGSNKGKIYIHSNYGILRCQYINGINYFSSISNNMYPGTLFEIIFRTDTMYIEPEMEDFTW